MGYLDGKKEKGYLLVKWLGYDNPAKDYTRTTLT